MRYPLEFLIGKDWGASKLPIIARSILRFENLTAKNSSICSKGDALFKIQYFRGFFLVIPRI